MKNREEGYGIQTREDIVNSILNKTEKEIPQVSNYRVGSVFRLFIEVVASFLEKLYNELDYMLPNRFIQTARGKFLDLKAEELSITRYPAIKARGMVLFRRKKIGEDIRIDANKIVATKPNYQGEVLKYIVVESAVMKKGILECSVLVEAEFEGKNHNVVGGQIVDIMTPIAGIDFVTNNNNWMTSKGKDQESDDELRFRCIALWRGLSGANEDAYIYWAKSINGVEDVRVLCETLGTVKLIFTKTNNQIPDENIAEDLKLINDVRDNIERLKPIATALEVGVPEAMVIDINIDIEFLPHIDLNSNVNNDDEGSEENEGTKEIIRAEMIKIIKSYFTQLRIGYDFEPSALSKHIFKEYSGIKSIEINKNSEVITEGHIAMAGKINITMATADEL